MKRFLMSAFFVLILLPLFSKAGLELTYRILKESNTLDVLANTEEVSMKIALRQDRDGRFSIQSPPFVVADLDGIVRVGELKDARILSALLDPFSDLDLEDGFIQEGNLKKVSSPSLSPRFSGVAICLPHVDILSFNPLMNRLSPSAFAVIAGNDTVFAGLMHASGENQRTQKLQTDWRRLANGRNMVFSIVGAASKANLSGIEINSFAYVQSSWDRFLGGGTSTVWSARARSDKLEMSLSRHLGGIGPNLKAPKGEQRPVDVIECSVCLRDEKLKIEVSYKESIYEKPVYGGRSQVALIQMGSSFGTKCFEIHADHSTSYESDFGKISKTIFSVNGEYQKARLKAQIEMLRPSTQSCSLTDPSLEITFEHAKFGIKDQKTELELSLERQMDGMRMKLSIDQDRMLTASFRFEK